VSTSAVLLADRLFKRYSAEKESYKSKRVVAWAQPAEKRAPNEIYM
jgi:hypothetical protein